MQFLLTIKNVEDVKDGTPKQIARELMVVLENEGYEVNIVAFPQLQQFLADIDKLWRG